MSKDLKFRIRFTAADAASREAGLMHAEPLEQDEVAFFVFPHNDRFAFWNKNVNFGLTLAFLNESGIAVDFADLEPNQLSPVSPSTDARYVVEALKGSFEPLGIKKGDVFIYEGDSIRIAKTTK